MIFDKYIKRAKHEITIKKMSNTKQHQPRTPNANVDKDGGNDILKFCRLNV